MDPHLLDPRTHLSHFQISPTLDMLRDQNRNFTSEDNIHQSSFEVSFYTYKDTSVSTNIRDDNEPTVSVLNSLHPARYLIFTAFFGRS